MVRKGGEALMLLIVWLVVINILIASVQPYLPWVGLAVIIGFIVWVMWLMTRKRKYW